MKKRVLILISFLSTTIFSESFEYDRVKVEGRVGVGFDSSINFSNLVENTNNDLDVNSGFEVALETTIEYNWFDFGVGLAYQNLGDIDEENLEGDIFNSVPIYFIGRYEFKPIYSITPYIKANLGYSFNSNGKITNNSKTLDYEAENGFYYSIGGGIIYSNLVVDISYENTNADVYLTSDKSTKSNIDFDRVVLGVGYRF